MPSRQSPKATSHLGTDWEDQWQRVQRWHQQVEAIGAQRFDYGGDVESYRPWAGDVIYAFFMNCFHLKDWLVGSGATSKASVDVFIDGSEPMRWCRDICHGMKHFKLEPQRRTTTHAVWSTASASFSVTHVITFDATGESVAHQPREPVPGEHWYFTSGNLFKDMFDLADECMAAWRRFIQPLPGEVSGRTR